MSLLADVKEQEGILPKIIGGIKMTEENKDVTTDVEETTVEEENTFTQEDVNNIAAREAKKAQEKLFKELGIEDFEDAKEGMTKFQEWQDAQKTEAEKRDEKLENLEKDHLAIKSENEFLKAQLAASSKGVMSEAISDVVTLAQNLVTEEVDINAAIDQVIEKYPHFAGHQEEEEEEEKPRFTYGEHTTGGSKKFADPFQAKLEKYKQ